MTPDPPARSRGLGRLTAAAVLTGLAAGCGGILLTLVLHLVQHVAFGYTEDSFLTGVAEASGIRRVLAMTVGGAVVGIGWWALRAGRDPLPTVEAAAGDRSVRLPVLAGTADAVLQVVAVGSGASLGREGAPRQVGAAVGAFFADRLRVDAGSRGTLVACGAGAGLAAVYDVPISGALFALEAVLVSFAARDALPALLCSAVAVGVAGPVLSGRPTYLVPPAVLSPSLAVWSLLVGPLAAVAGTSLRSGALFARRRAPSGWRLPLATTGIFAAVGAASVAFPQLLGNGKGPAQLAFDGSLGLGLAAALLVLKPLATIACLGSGARGGLLTPAFATGALLGALTWGGWHAIWPGPSVTTCALVGAAAVLAVTLRAPLCAIALTLELTHTGLDVALPLVLAVAGAVLTARLLSPAHGGGQADRVPGASPVN